MTTFEVTRDEVVFAVGDPVSFDVVPVVTAFTVQPGPGADGTSFTARGPWDSGDTYAVGDVVSFDGGNYILYASPPTGGDPDVDTSHWDVFGSGAGVAPSRSISTTAPLSGGGDLSADRTLSIADATTSAKGAVQLEDSHTSTSTTKAATPKNVKEAYDLAAAAQPADSDLTAIAGATLTGDGYLKRASSVWSLDTPSGGGGSLPSPTGEVGAVLGVDESETYALQRYIQYGDGDAYAIAAVQTDRVRLEAADGLGGIAGVNVYMDGSVGIETTGPVAVTPGDGFHVTGTVGTTTLSGDDFSMDVADDNPAVSPGHTFARSRGDMGAKTAVADGDTLAAPLYALGHDGTDPVLAAVITAEVDGTVATGKVPTRIRIATADADGVLTDRMTIGADGTTDVLGDFTVNGSPVSGGGGGGLVLVDSGTFSGSSGFSVDGVFDSTYDDYLVVLIANGSTDIQLGLRLRVGGVDSSTDYSGVRLFAYSTSVGAQTNNLGSDEWQINNVGSAGPPSVARLDFYGPALASPSAMIGVASGYFSSTGTITTHLNGSHDASTTYDGFSIRPDTGTITGRWVVYGYPK